MSDHQVWCNPVVLTVVMLGKTGIELVDGRGPA